MVDDQYPLKGVVFIGGSKKELVELIKKEREGEKIGKAFGHGINEAQHGLIPKISKPLPQFGPRVLELVFDGKGTTYRCTIYLTKLTVYILIPYKKKSKSGISIPQEIVEATSQRLKKAKDLEQGK